MTTVIASRSSKIENATTNSTEKPKTDTSIQTKPRGLSSVSGKQRELMKIALRNTIEPVSANTIRRHRIKYNEAICFELEEDGYKITAEYIRQLIALNEEIRNSHGPDTWMWIQPQLKNSNKQLDILKDGLVDAENANRKGQKLIESQSILKLAIHFMQMPEAWWWLAEQLFAEAIEVSESFRSDGGRTHAVIRYIFGRFLLLQLEDYVTAREHLRFVREHSQGTTWVATELDIPQETVFQECCILLTDVILKFCDEYQEYDPLKAARTCAIALRRAKESKNPKSICKAYLQLGLFNLEACEPQTALLNFLQYVSVSTLNNNYPGICEGLIHVALAYTKLGKAKDAEKNLMQAIQTAKDNNLPFHEGQGHRYAGEFYLNQNTPKKGSHHFIDSFNILIDVGNHKDQDEIRCLAGVAKGNYLMNNYTKLILCCGRHDKKMRNISKLCRWKGHRDDFWSDMYEEDFLNTSILHGSYQSVVSITHIEDIINSIVENTLKFIIPDIIEENEEPVN